jgi:hypothetical protein
MINRLPWRVLMRVGQTLGESAEALDDEAAGIGLGFNKGGREAMALCAAQAQPIKARQNACNQIAKSVKKSRRE